LNGFAYLFARTPPSAKNRMRPRLIIVLALYGAVCSSIGFGRARADDFDDDFGTLPAAPKPVPPKPVPAPTGPAPGVSAAPPGPLPPPSATDQILLEHLAAPVGARIDNGDTPLEGAYPPLDDDPAPLPTSPSARRRTRRTFVHPTVDGLVGGVHVVDASSAWPGTFRLAFNTDYFRKDGYTAKGDHHRDGGATLSLNFTPIEHLELAALVATHVSQNRTTEPELIQVVGDLHLFAKGFTEVLPWLTVGGDAELALLNGVGSIGIDGKATSVGLRASATADLRALPDHALPLVLRSNFRYLFDSSAHLARSIEQQRYASLQNPAPPADEYRHLLNPAERYGLQVSRVDRIGMSFGVEVPLVPRERVHVSPLLEWTFALPVNRQGYNCLITSMPGRKDGCLDQTGFAARPSFFTFGVRVQPWVAGLAVLTAVDVATSGARTFVSELAPLERYVFRIGLSYAYDPRKAPVQRPKVRRIEIPANSARGHIVGQVLESQTGMPVSGAIVHFEGTSLSDVVSDDKGAFRSAELAPGAQGMRVRVEGYREALCVAVITASGGDVSARCELTPSAYYGTLAGRVVDNTDKPLAGAHVVVRGPSELTMTTARDGSFAAGRLQEGSYELTVSAENHIPRDTQLSVSRGATSAPTTVLFARPATPQVRRTPKRLVLRRPVQFTADSAIITADSEPVLAEAAELLKKSPDIAHVEVQAHLDDTSAVDAQVLSEQRAQAVRAWLVSNGVAESRLEAKGYGATRPLAPNITPQNRARNRRIELLIK
jgi:outer membrane protein OmpA-like peptidoglycan-associated protein